MTAESQRAIICKSIVLENRDFFLDDILGVSRGEKEDHLSMVKNAEIAVYRKS